MKKILLLSFLFISLFCNGQVYDPEALDTSINIHLLPTPIIYEPMYNPTIPMSTKLETRVITIQDLLDYQQECSKDTCWVTYDQWVQDKIPCILGNGDYDIIEEKFIEQLQKPLLLVRRTPTFEGFLKYLEE